MQQLCAGAKRKTRKGFRFSILMKLQKQLPTNQTVPRKNKPMRRDNGGEGEWEGLLVARFRSLREVSQKFESSSPRGSKLFSGLNVTTCVSTDIRGRWRVCTNARVLQTPSAVSGELKVVEGQKRERTGRGNPSVGEDEDEEPSNVKSESFFSFETRSFLFFIWVFFSFGNDAKRNGSPSMGV